MQAQSDEYRFFCRELKGQWGWMALRGVAALLFGLLAFAAPLATIWTLALLWGAFACADGVFSLVSAWNMHKKGVRWWPYLLYGIIGLLAGLLTFAWPGITAIILVYLVGFWALLGGISEIVAALRLRKEMEGEWLLILAGGVSVLFGLLVLFGPLPAGVAAIAFILGIYAVALGVMFCMLAWKIRQCAV